MVSFGCHAAQVTGVTWEEQSPTSSISKRVLCHWVLEDVDYTNGGITITYPANWFAVAPMLQVSILLKDHVYATNDDFTTVVTANSASSTTVRINLNGAEAATNDVTVHVYALANP